jgi:hypothetical protein
VPTIFAVPAVVPAVNVAVQLAVPTVLVPWARVQGEVAPKEPVAVPDMANETVPEGVETVPEFVAGSTTVAVQAELPPKVTVEGLHDTVVVVGRRLTVTDAAVTLALFAWAVSVVA